MEMEDGSTCLETESAGFIRLAKRAVVYCICGQGGLALAVHSPEIEKSRGLLDSLDARSSVSRAR